MANIYFGDWLITSLVEEYSKGSEILSWMGNSNAASNIIIIPRSISVYVKSHM